MRAQSTCHSVHPRRTGSDVETLAGEPGAISGSALSVF